MLALFMMLVNVAFAMNMQQVDQNRLKVINSAEISYDKEARPEGLAELFVGGPIETSLTNLEARGLSKGRANVQPWSGHYWANINGGLGYRWADPYFPTKNYGNGLNYVNRVLWNQTYWNYLSPAEKYDYLTGVTPGTRGSLTSHQWTLGYNEYNTTGQVAEWQGICHGWAPASIYMPAPKRDVIFKFPAGDLTFTIEDIKAIGALYWANGKFESVFAGWRCDSDRPNQNGEGRILDPKCFDVNPGDWHLALTNLVGARRESFILDAAETSQVWNHPVVSYSMQYFDPTNFNSRGNSARGLMRERSRTPNLRHGQFRSPKTVWVVGVVSTVTYGTESKPGDRRNLTETVAFTYDLEMDENFNIIGGEWRNKTRPDFLWRRKDQQVPQAVGRDAQLDMWRMGDANWRAYSLENSAKGVPMKFFVEKLFQMSSAQ